MWTNAPAILFAKLSLNVQPRLVTLPWLRRNVVRCFSQNADVSGLPVRYIPKKQRDVNQTQSCTPVDIKPKDGVPTRERCDVNQMQRGTLVDITLKDGVPTRLSSTVFLSMTFECSKSVNGDSDERKLLNTPFDAKNELNHEHEYCNKVGDNEVVEAPVEVVECVKAAEEDAGKPLVGKGHGLNVGGKINEMMCYDELVDEEYMEAPEEVEETQFHSGIGKGKSDRTKQGAEKLAVELLAKRAFTAVELRKKLSAKNFSVSTVEAVVHDFQRRGLINDGLYAETFSQSRWKSSSWGPRRIKQALTKKGVSEVHVEKAVKLVFEDPKEGDQRSSIKLSSSSLHQLYMQAAKQWQRSQNVSHENRKARVIRWLQYRGFDWGVIGTIMMKLETECPP